MTIRNFTKRLLLASVSAVFSRARAQNQIALTFDDGPDPVYTLQVSTILREAGAKATFFLVGENMRKYPAIVEQLLLDGHELGSHSMTHPEIRDLPTRCLPEEVDAMYRMALVDGSTAISNRYFRPPKGVVSVALVSHCWKKDIRLIFWNRDPEDYKATSAQEIIEYFDVDPPRQGDIVLLHDKTAQIVAALPALLARVRLMHLRTVTISELLAPTVLRERLSLP